jgi:hypothetical protein
LFQLAQQAALKQRAFSVSDCHPQNRSTNTSSRDGQGAIRPHYKYHARCHRNVQAAFRDLLRGCSGVGLMVETRFGVRLGEMNFDLGD